MVLHRPSEPASLSGQLNDCREPQSSTFTFTIQCYGFADQDVQGIWSAPSGAQVAWFKDPDGNVLSLTQFT